MGMRILGWGTALPDRVVTNSDLEKTLDTSDEWIVERSGIRERRIGDVLELVDGEVIVSPSPSSPLGLYPQHLTVPLSSSAQACALPTATAFAVRPAPSLFGPRI